MVVTKFDKGQRRQQRKAARRNLGRLADLVIQKRTVKRYSDACTCLFLWLTRNGIDISNLGDMQKATFEWVEECWEEGESLSVAADSLSGLQHFIPELKGQLKGAWRMLGAWRLKEPADRAPPMLPFIVEAMAFTAIQSGELVFAAILLIGFHLFLRTGELMALRVQDLLFATSGKSCVINLGFTKTGKRKGMPEQVLLRDAKLIVLLRLSVSSLQPGDYLWGAKPSAFRTRFKQACAAEQVEQLGFRPYSLRRGGATAAFQAGLSYDSIAEISRHSSLKSLKIYVNDAMAEALSYHISAPLRRRLQGRAAAMNSLLG